MKAFNSIKVLLLLSTVVVSFPSYALILAEGGSEKPLVQSGADAKLNAAINVAPLQANNPIMQENNTNPLALNLNTKPITDTDIISNIRSEFAANNSLSDLKVEITCEDGVVSLCGKVNNYLQANSLIVISEATEGVKDVNVSNLLLKNNTRLSNDAVISAKIRGTYIRENVFNDTKLNEIKVVTLNGVVTLIGPAENLEQIKHAIDIANTIKGVDKVKSQMVVLDGSQKVAKN